MVRVLGGWKDGRASVVEAMALHLGGVIDHRRRLFMSILEGCAVLEDMDTHLLTCGVGGIHLHETHPFSRSVVSSPFSKYEE